MSIRISLPTCAVALSVACVVCTGHAKRARVRNARGEALVGEDQNKAEAGWASTRQFLLEAAQLNHLQTDGRAAQQSHTQAHMFIRALSRLFLAFRSPTLGASSQIHEKLPRRATRRHSVVLEDFQLPDNVNPNAFPKEMEKHGPLPGQVKEETVSIPFPCPFGFANDTLEDLEKLSAPFAQGGPWRKVKDLAMTPYGEVDLVANKDDVAAANGMPELFVVKTYRRKKMNARKDLVERKVTDSAWNEIRAYDRLRKIDFPGVVKIYGTWQDEDCFYVASEYCPGGNLYDRMVEGQITTEEQVHHIISEQLFIFRRFHDEGYAHQNVDLTNFLVCPDRTLRLIDFGQAMRVNCLEGEHNEKFITLHREGHPGQADYLSPELLRHYYSNDANFKGAIYSSKKLDMFQIGAGLLRLLSKRAPYKPKELMDAGGPNSTLFPPAEAESDRCLRVRQFLRNSTDRITPISVDCVDFLERLLCPKRSLRPDVFEASAHPWIINGPGNVTASAAGKEEWRLQFYREMIADLYEDFNPSKVEEVDMLMAKYKGREQDLHKAVRIKYLGTDPLQKLQSINEGEWVSREDLDNEGELVSREEMDRIRS